MKLMIASDIHGSAYWCEKLMEAYEREKPDKLLFLGDILYHGPRNALPRDYDPARVAEMLNGVSDRILAVRGNCDSEVDQMVLDWPNMADSCVLFCDGVTIFATHGHVFDEKHPPKLHAGDVLLTGHTHLQVCEKVGDFIHLNPGSVSIPKGESTYAYLRYEDGIFTWIELGGAALSTYRIGDAI